jgi:hypothetical protein
MDHQTNTDCPKVQYCVCLNNEPNQTAQNKSERLTLTISCCLLKLGTCLTSIPKQTRWEHGSESQNRLKIQKISTTKIRIISYDDKNMALHISQRGS